MSSYKEEIKAKDREKLEELLQQLPSYVRIFHERRDMRLAPKTQATYASRMLYFLNYLQEHNPNFTNKEVHEITLTDLSMLTADDFAEFSSWMLKQKKVKNSSKYNDLNKKTTADHYLSCLSSYFTFFVRRDMLQKNPVLGVERMKRHEKPIIHIRDEEQLDLMDTVTQGIGLTEAQKRAWEKNKLRETCIVQLLLDTGIRVSELVGLDIEDVNLKHCMLSIQRKGDKLDHAYFSDATADLLAEYIAQRELMYTQKKGERALFLVSLGKYKGTRLSVRSVQMLVKKYAMASEITDAALITPHKLRSSYAMSMLKETGNEMIVKEQLGHENVATTAIYARATEEDKIKHRNAIF